MKKTLLMAFLTVALISCNKKDPNSKQLNNSEETLLDSCIGLKEYRNIGEDIKKAEWLKEKGDSVCKDTLYKEMFKEHALSSTEYDKYKKEFGNQTPLKMKWNTIKDTIRNHFYDKYVGFNTKDKEITSIYLIPGYLEKGGSYSIPLFLSIADSLKLKDDDTTTEFEFIQTKESTSPIIFKVVNNGKGFEMNYSTKPLKK